MARPRIAYVVSSQVAFLPHPRERCRWLRLHPCVLYAVCSSCKAQLGEPCVDRDGEAVGYVHWKRKREGDQRRKGNKVPIIAAIIVPLLSKARTK